MNKRWTIKELDEIDDITFAMCILSERREMLNQYAPLTKKIHKSYHALEELRDICRSDPNYTIGISSIKDTIYRHFDREHLIADMERHLREEKHDLQGLTPDEVLADADIMAEIIRKYDICERGEDDWYAMEHAIEEGIKEMLNTRNGA